MLRLALIICLTSSALGADAFAQAPGETAIAAPAPEVRTSYRRQLIVADSIAVGVVGGAVAAGAWLFHPDDFHLPLMVGAFGFNSYALTAPIIHFAHGKVGRGFASLGARILIPAITATAMTVGLGLEEHDDGWGAAMGTGFAIGAVGAIALDWFVLTPSTAPSAAAEQPAPLVTPTISASAEHVFFGVGGAL